LHDAPQRAVHRLGVAKYRGHVRLEEHKIASVAELPNVFPAHAASKVVLVEHAITICHFLLHKFSALGGLPGER